MATSGNNDYTSNIEPASYLKADRPHSCSTVADRTWRTTDARLSQTDQGLLVIDCSGPAAQAGIQGGSPPVSINGMTVPVGGDHCGVDGRPVRTAQREDVVVMLAERPPATAQATTGG
jgi:hypothetical protein